ncbi:hypothetical protein D1631_05650 [Chryseobacterium nematophagum]|uniref:Uncharacterized protein n=1 Tax=Chryseobacterium nematophagum TaxID=2305228 RepID=A0A3M7TCZ8_9FLAO|nr:hypothetical protein [Chryseobacterium nematophagum]RNA61453.1 hypothetical protein D1631_05650 [Chryseobacterium nematophagum]
MRKNYFRSTFAISFILLASIQSCVHESLETEISNINQDPIYFIKNEYLKEKTIISGKQIEWHQLQTFKSGENIILITVPIKNENKNTIEKLTFRIDRGKVSGNLWKYESENTFLQSDYKLSSHEIMNDFSGTISYISLEGSMQYTKKMIEGKFIDEIGTKNSPRNINNPSCNRCHIASIDEVIIPSPGGGGNNPIPENPTVPIPSVGIFNPETPQNNDPCSKIKQQKGKAEYNQKINDLKGKTGQQTETGYSQRTNGNYSYHNNATNNSSSNALSLPNSSLVENKDISGYMHTHIDDFNGDDGLTRMGIKMFSPADIGYFMDMLANAQAQGRSLGDVYGVMVTSTGVYQIRFTGNANQIKTFTKQQIKALTEPYKKNMGNTKNLESNFLKFLKNKMGIEGVNLYKTPPVGKAKEIKINSDNTISESDCP